MKTRPSYKEFKQKALMDDEIKKPYEQSKPFYDIKLKLIQMRKEANLTQEEIANIMNTKRSNISRLESFNYEAAPKVTTLIAYAEATGHKLKIEFI
jgi:transcriptional regulator